MKYIYSKTIPDIRRFVNENANDFEMPEDFTDVEPLGMCFFPLLPVQHFDESPEEWVLDDDCLERAYLDSKQLLPALKIRRAMATMQGGEDGKTALDDLKSLFETYPDFEKEWNIAYPNNEINLKDVKVQAALEKLNIDIDEVKRKVLKINEQ